MATLSIKNARKSYGALEVLKGVTLEAEDGEFIALVGPSGCGKSTLLNMIAGLETITAGEIHIGDRLVNAVPPKDRDIAMVFQSYALYPTMSVRENITFGMESRKIPKAEQNAAVDRVSSLLQIEPLLRRKPGQLSGGQRQRVAMGRALVRDPALFLFDEPLSNLDAKLRIDMRTEIKKLHAKVGKTTVYVTHDQVEAMTLASRIAVMYGGELQQFDKPETVYNKPANLFVAGFMGSPSMNFLQGKIGNGAIQIENGPSLALPDVQNQDGRSVTIGLRPEHIFRDSPDIRARKAQIATAEATAEVVEPTGSETIAVMRLAGQEIVARFEPDEAPREGETLSIAIDMSHACLFDPTTEKLI
ncbi:MAG: ABC transporter ATP-binding protein [Marinosulfonomonas sp.]